MSWPTDISDRDANPGMTWPILAAMGSCGRSSSRTCVDFSVEPSGIVTVTGFVAGKYNIQRFDWAIPNRKLRRYELYFCMLCLQT